MRCAAIDMRKAKIVRKIGPPGESRPFWTGSSKRLNEHWIVTLGASAGTVAGRPGEANAMNQHEVL